MKSFLLRFGVGLVAATFGASAAFAQQDQLYKTNDEVVRGLVSGTTPGSVTMTVNGAAQPPIPSSEIKRLIFAEEPGELRRGRESVLTQQYEDAVAELAKVPAGNYPSLVQQDIDFYKAYSAGQLALKGSPGSNATEAAAALVAFTRANPDSWHYYDARKAAGDLAALTGNYDYAASAYGELLQAPSLSMKVEGKLLQSDALMRLGKHEEALAGYKQVAGANANGDDAIEKYKEFAKVGQAVATAHTGQPAEAIKSLNEIIATTDPTRDQALYAKIYNGLGAAHLKANAPKEALLAYLHVDLLFLQDPDAHAEALYNLSKLWGSLNQSQRALDARQTLRERYGSSSWASKD